MIQNRRDLMQLALTTGAAALLPSSFVSGISTPTERPVPAGTLSKFNPDGSVRGFAGNTVIAHLPAQCTLRDAAIGLHDALRTSPFARKFALLPPESYHMTVFGGANDQGRSSVSWPNDIGLEVPIGECTRILSQRLEGFRMGCPLPFRMKIDVQETAANLSGCGLRLNPASEEADRGIRALRDGLAEVFAFRANDHARYQFHISIAYQIAALTSSEDAGYRALMEEHASSIAARVPVVELGLPEFCSFRDMDRYDLLLYLRTR